MLTRPVSVTEQIERTTLIVHVIFKVFEAYTTL